MNDIDTKGVLHYVPGIETRAFYHWVLAATITPTLVHLVIYAVVVLPEKPPAPMSAAPPSVAVFLAIVSTFLLWRMIVKAARKETERLRAAVNKGVVSDEDLKRLSGFPGRIARATLSHALVPLLPGSVYTYYNYAYDAVLVLFSVLLVAVPFLFCLPPIAALLTVSEEAIGKSSSSLWNLLPMPRIADRLEGQLLRRSLLILVGSAAALLGLLCFYLSFLILRRREIGLFQVIFAVGEALAWYWIPAGVCVVLAVCGAWVLSRIGRNVGRHLKTIASYFDTLVSVEVEKTMDGMRVIVPRGLITAQVASLWKLTAQLLGDIAQMRRLAKEAIDEMVQNHKAKTLFLASMSHDLKSPLGSIIGFSELLLKDSEGELTEEQRKNIRLIRDAGEELLGLISNVLDTARLEAGTFELHKEWTPSVELVTGVVKSRAHLLGGKEIAIQTEIQPGIPPAFVDPQRISQVLSCLISTTVKFMEKGSIQLRVYVAKSLLGEDEKFLRIDIQSRGTGIKQSDMEKIFESFKQAESSLVKPSSSLELGLGLSKSIIELHEGKIWLENEAGAAPCFSIAIPMGRTS